MSNPDEYEVYDAVPVQNDGNGVQMFCDNLNNVSNSVSNISSGIAAIGDVFVRMGENKNRREEIKAQRDVDVARIKSQTKILSQSINGTFKEREKTLEKIHDVCDKALETHNNEALGMALNAMCGMAENSVIKQISNVKINAPESKILPDRSQSLDI